MHMHNIIGVISIFQAFLRVLTKLGVSRPFVIFGRKANEITDTATTPKIPKMTFLLVNWLMYSFPSKLKNTNMLHKICLKYNIKLIIYWVTI